MGVAPRSVGVGLVVVVPRSWEEEPKFLGDQREEERVKQVVKKENPKQNSWHWKAGVQRKCGVGRCFALVFLLWF